MTSRTGKPYKTLVTPDELKLYRELGMKASVPSIWNFDVLYYRANHYAYTAPRGSFWPQLTL